MNYKELIDRLILLLLTPSKGWVEVKEEDEEKVKSAFVYPLIALCGVATFIGTWLGNGVDTFNLQLILTKCCGVFVSLFVAFYLSSHLLEYYGHRFADRPEKDFDNCRKLVGYSMSVIFVLEFFGGLFPTFLILRWILQFYVVYVVWEGAKELMEVSEKNLLSYSLVASVIILLVPEIMNQIFGWLTQMVN